MVVKFLSKYILEVIPSIVATVVGAYIVTHYINAKPDADKAKTEASAPAQKADSILPKAAKVAPAQSDVAEKPSEKSSDTVSAPSEPRRVPIKEKAIAKASAPEPKTVSPETAKTEDDRDANEIARAAIARLRKSEPVESPRTQPRVVAATPPVASPAPVLPQVQNQPSPPVQPPVQVSAPVVTPAPPLTEVTIPPAPQPVARADDPSRPMPPAEIPLRPLDIRAKPYERTSVADDVVSAAKTMFHSVIPGIN